MLDLFGNVSNIGVLDSTSCLVSIILSSSSIDSLANKYMKDWTIDKIDKIGAAIMRIAIYELKYTETPQIVAINEAVELAKEYSDENVRKIINATLDKIIRD